ncbi:unnamed protein product [Polarella glacialis]|uniref:Methyltransferase FkbM domain-containing protein n=1 Tax=Polarella glacialis TaxID=89957 RepID=A0A813FR46_POLGL|nr:unnamed protein product [Polarella glacialis]
MGVFNLSCAAALKLPLPFFMHRPALDISTGGPFESLLAAKDPTMWGHRWRVAAGPQEGQVCWLAPARQGPARFCWNVGDDRTRFTECCYTDKAAGCWGPGYSPSSCCREVNLRPRYPVRLDPTLQRLPLAERFARVRNTVFCPPLGAPPTCEIRVSLEMDEAYFDAEHALVELRTRLHESKLGSEELAAWQQSLELGSLAACGVHWEPCLSRAQRAAMFGEVCHALRDVIQVLNSHGVKLAVAEDAQEICKRIGLVLRRIGSTLNSRLKESQASVAPIRRLPRAAETVAFCGADAADFQRLFGNSQAAGAATTTTITATTTTSFNKDKDRSMLEMELDGTLPIPVLRRILHTLRDRAPGERLRVVNLGSNDGSCHPDLDPANCLAFSGEADGLFLEAFDPVFNKLAAVVDREVRSRAGHVGFLQAKHVAATPETFPELMRTELPSAWQGDVDLFKIDIDHGDCQFLKPLLGSGPNGRAPALRPRLLYVEFNIFYPPPFDYRQHFDMECNDGLRVLSHGCSLSAFTKLGLELGYRLVRCMEKDAIFVREDLLPRLMPDFPETKLLLNRSVLEHYREGVICHPVWGPQLRSKLSSTAEVRTWADFRFPLEARAKQIEALRRLDEASSCGRGILTW